VARVYRFARESGLPVRAPVIDLIEIGAGGGSIARADRFGLPRVGPESAGAEPGPACYGRGGTEPTVTDADLVLGYLDPGFFLGGEMRLAPERARAVGVGLGTAARRTSCGDGTTSSGAGAARRRPLGDRGWATPGPGPSGSSLLGLGMGGATPAPASDVDRRRDRRAVPDARRRRWPAPRPDRRGPGTGPEPASYDLLHGRGSAVGPSVVSQQGVYP
jgi:5-oxoprolinase (ATP-hydrolysing)